MNRRPRVDAAILAVLLFLAALTIAAHQKIDNNIPAPEGYDLEMTQVCPACDDIGVYRGGLVVWEYDGSSYIGTHADRLPVFWCPACGNLFSRRVRTTKSD